MTMALKSLAAVSLTAMALTFSVSANAQVTVGNSGVLGADGVVTTPPIGGAYRYVSTDGGVAGGGSLGIGAETDGSSYQTAAFEAAAGATLEFYFNYVTSDGSGFADYGWASLNDGTSDLVLFTARTTPTGDTVPGFGLPGLAPGVVLTPDSTPIIPGGPVWSPLGGSSGECFDDGCGYTGWIKSTYTVTTGGTYTLTFGVTNWSDTAFDSGLAFAGLVIDDVPIDPPPVVPEPATWMMLIAGFGLVGFAARRRRSVAVA